MGTGFAATTFCYTKPTLIGFRNGSAVLDNGIAFPNLSKHRYKLGILILSVLRWWDSSEDASSSCHYWKARL